MIESNITGKSEDGIEYVIPKSNSSTDIVISTYENKISQNIATKTLKASKSGEKPKFTEEELLYLNKKASENNVDEEIAVITPDPTITLKKGKTELNIKGAASMVRLMNNKYPVGTIKTNI